MKLLSKVPSPSCVEIEQSLTIVSISLSLNWSPENCVTRTQCSATKNEAMNFNFTLIVANLSKRNKFNKIFKFFFSILNFRQKPLHLVKEATENICALCSQKQIFHDDDDKICKLSDIYETIRFRLHLNEGWDKAGIKKNSREKISFD